MKGDSKCSVISAITHSGRGTPGEDEKRGQAAIRWAWLTLACTDAPPVGSRVGAEGAGERKMSSNHNHMRENGEQFVTHAAILRQT